MCLFPYLLGRHIVPRLYFVPETELLDEPMMTGSVRESISHSMDPMKEKVPFQMAQALYLTTKITSME